MEYLEMPSFLLADKEKPNNLQISYRTTIIELNNSFHDTIQYLVVYRIPYIKAADVFKVDYVHTCNAARCERNLIPA